MKQQETGIAHLGIVLAVVLILAAVAFGGWWVWDKNHTDKIQIESQEASTNYPSEDKLYLVIEEWGVRMPTDNKIADAKYRVSEDGMYLSTESIESVPGCESGQVVLLQRSQRDGDFDGLTVDELLARPNNPLVKVGDYYYLENGPPSDCTSLHNAGKTEDQKKFSEIRNSYRVAIKRLEQN